MAIYPTQEARLMQELQQRCRHPGMGCTVALLAMITGLAPWTILLWIDHRPHLGLVHTTDLEHRVIIQRIIP